MLYIPLQGYLVNFSEMGDTGSSLATGVQVTRAHLCKKYRDDDYASSHSSGRSLCKSSLGVVSICFNTFVSCCTLSQKIKMVKNLRQRYGVFMGWARYGSPNTNF